ncbi:DUF6215 domain-containing protein [Streptomyces sp. ME02-8801-2C]|uniref:DUF6215 domain-containing protein n=1 Tax=Streptomyces sp. ME02-8801-2C TaxID=3028680 RepID=UPI0029BE70D5|nr:DUF6215 domain-containing protein [Streptomyces sp. ME02-8801-2C]MDX3453216.1 DUF6215 domain-containing protein [Streptomyces sp. ME02-8801-2C]
MTNDIDVPRSAEPTEPAGTTEPAKSAKGMSEGAQVVSALIVVACLAVGFWVIAKNQPDPKDSPPASCSRSDDDVPLSKPVSGVQLCEALNRPDLPTLLGTPDDRALGAYSHEATSSDKLDVMSTDPEATVQLEGYSLKLTEAEDISVADITDSEFLSVSGERKTVLGHSAFLYSGRTLGFVFKDGKGSTGPGGISRNLLVAKDPEDGGGTYEISIWRQDDLRPDDAALLRVAEQVLPTVPGWPTG